jgi:hypothetical protein
MKAVVISEFVGRVGELFSRGKQLVVQGESLYPLHARVLDEKAVTADARLVSAAPSPM